MCKVSVRVKEKTKFQKRKVIKVGKIEKQRKYVCAFLENNRMTNGNISRTALQYGLTTNVLHDLLTF